MVVTKRCGECFYSKVDLKGKPCVDCFVQHIHPKFKPKRISSKKTNKELTEKQKIHRAYHRGFKLGEITKLISLILEWWENHQYDTYVNEDDEYNVYDSEPDFVIEAKRLLKEVEKK